MDIDDIIQLLNASKNLTGDAKRSFLVWIQGKLNAISATANASKEDLNGLNA